MRSKEGGLCRVRFKASFRDEHIACAATPGDHRHAGIVRRIIRRLLRKGARVDRRIKRGGTAGEGRYRYSEAKVDGGKTRHRAPSMDHLNTKPEFGSGVGALTRAGAGGGGGLGLSRGVARPRSRTGLTRTGVMRITSSVSSRRYRADRNNAPRIGRSAISGIFS